MYHNLDTLKIISVHYNTRCKGDGWSFV